MPAARRAGLQELQPARIHKTACPDCGVYFSSVATMRAHRTQKHKPATSAAASRPRTQQELRQDYMRFAVNGMPTCCFLRLGVQRVAVTSSINGALRNPNLHYLRQQYLPYPSPMIGLSRPRHPRRPMLMLPPFAFLLSLLKLLNIQTGDRLPQLDVHDTPDGHEDKGAQCGLESLQSSMPVRAVPYDGHDHAASSHGPRSLSSGDPERCLQESQGPKPCQCVKPLLLTCLAAGCVVDGVRRSLE